MAAEPKRKATSVEPTGGELAIGPNREKPGATDKERCSQHAYLQNVVKRIGERCGYRAAIELPVMGGVGKIDVALENENHRVAVEIARTNTADYELNNIQKCLAAGFDHVVILATDLAHLRRCFDRGRRLSILSPPFASIFSIPKSCILSSHRYRCRSQNLGQRKKRSKAIR